MSRFNWIFGAVLLLLAIAGVIYVVHHDRALAPAPEGNSADTSAANGSSTIITYTDAGFSPPAAMVTPGTTITWSNQSSRTLWVLDASIDAGTCSKTSLNECASIGAGGTYSFTAPASGTLRYVNKMHPEDTGSITVSTRSGMINPDAVPQ